MSRDDVVNALPDETNRDEHTAAKPQELTRDQQAALWLLLGRGLDETGKEKWLSWRLDEGYTVESIFMDALGQMDGMVAT